MNINLVSNELIILQLATQLAYGGAPALGRAANVIMISRLSPFLKTVWIQQAQVKHRKRLYYLVIQ